MRLFSRTHTTLIHLHTRKHSTHTHTHNMENVLSLFVRFFQIFFGFGFLEIDQRKRAHYPYITKKMKKEYGKPTNKQPQTEKRY